MHRFKFWRSQQAKKLVQYGLATIMALVVVVVGLDRSPALATPALHYTELEFPPLPEIEIPDYSEFELDNGLRVYLLEDHELPLVSGTAMIYTGERFEPADQVGLATIVGEVMRSGGTTVHPPDELNMMLEQRAASIETGIDTASGSAGFNTVTEDLPTVFSLFAEVLRQPAFPEDRIGLAKNQRRGAIARRNDSPGDIARREFLKRLYGDQSPYARTVEYHTLDNIDRDAVMTFYGEYFHPNTTLLGIVGDFDAEQMRALIEAEFGDWERGPNLNLEDRLPEVSQAHRGEIFYVNQPQLTQSSVQIGHLGGRLDDPDYAALSIMNEVMNGLGGRLVNEVRSRQGLAYSVYTVWSPRFDYPGLLIGGGQTQNVTTVPFIQSTLAELEKIRSAPITEEELNRAKDGVLNSFIFNFEKGDQVLSRIMRYHYYGYPEDFIFNYQQEVEATTIADVQQAAQTHLKPEDIVTVVVGNNEQIQPPLSTLNPETQITQIDISIPAPQS